MIIRKVVEDDAEVLAKHNVSMAKESENIDIEYDITHSGIQAVIMDSTKGFYLVAEENGDIVGQLMITFEWSDWRNENIWWIQSVYIEPSWRRKGVFGDLLEEIYRLGMAKGVHIFRLYVHRSNVDAIEVYRHLKMVDNTYQIFERCILE